MDTDHAAAKDCSDDLLRVEEGSLYPALIAWKKLAGFGGWIKKDTDGGARV